MPFPGIPEDVLEGLEEPNPLDLGPLRDAIQPFADPPDGPLGGVLDYGRLLLATNTVVNLTGAKDWTTLIEAHLLDALVAARFVPDDARLVVDWGSGAGLPGLVWANVFPEKQIFLAERTGKKAEFLLEASVRLGLLNAVVLEGQAEEVWKREGSRADVIVARAVEPLPKLLSRLYRNRVSFRSLFVMAGPRWEAEWEGLSDEQRRPWKLAARHRYELPGNRGERFVVVFHPR